MFMEIAEHWATIVNTLRDGLMVVDPKGQILFVNPAAENLTGYVAGDITGKSCRILNCTGCEIYGLGSSENFCGLYKQGEVKAKKCMIVNKAGRSVHVVKNARVLRDAQNNVIGAIETLTDMSEIVRQEQEIESLRISCQMDDGYHGLIGESLPMQQVYELINNVAQTDTPVMIQGQSGTGKELVARAIHESGPRATKAFIKVNCAALNENLLESELFGHVKGAYTGADRFRVGRFEAAHEGTIFLDEIGDIPLSIQVKLLRVLEQKEIERVGENQPISVDVRIITATNRDLERLTSDNEFREDLFFRINVFPITCPSLVQRLDDIPLLVQHFIRQNAVRTGKSIAGLTPEALQALARYPWPGNIRELRNTIEYAFVLCKEEDIGIAHLPPKISGHANGAFRSHLNTTEPHREREQLLRALKQAGGNQSEAAKILGVSRVTVWKRIKKYGVSLSTEIS
jgi:PAS domain S-box-containing protein